MPVADLAAPRRPPPPGGPFRRRGARAAALAGGSAPLLVIALAVSMHLGSALATGLFDSVGPVGALWLRCALAALLLLAVGGRRALALPRERIGGVAALGAVLAAMNVCFFESIARIPLGIASTIEFTGPLLVALAGLAAARRRRLRAARRPRRRAARRPERGIDPAGAAFAFGSAACWGAYILLAKRLVGGAEPLPVLTGTMVVAAAVLHRARRRRGRGGAGDARVLLVALAVAALASAIPYLLELLALRLVSAATFSVLLSLEPAIAAIIGLLVLGQALGALEVAAVGCVVVASATAARSA